MAAVDPESAAPPVQTTKEVILRCWPLLLGNMVEWYEFSVFGYLTPQLRDVFFGGSSFATWFCFAITFVARPLGGVVLGRLADRNGRKAAFSISILGMLVGTVGQGLLPTRRENGEVLGCVGLVLMVLCRFIQGFSTGAEVSTITTYLVEVSPKESLGLVTSVNGVTGMLAFVVSNSVVAGVYAWLGSERMLAWGWRLPFLFALLPGLVAAWGRRRFPESEMFLEEIEAQKRNIDSPAVSAQTSGPAAFAALLRVHGVAILLAICCLAGSTVGGYVGSVWMMAHLQKMGADASTVLAAGIAHKVLILLLCPVSGLLTDRFGVGLMTFCGCVSIVVVGLPVYMVLQTCYQNDLVLFLVYTFGSLITGVFGQDSLLVVELFPTSVRSMGMGLSYNIGMCVFGGFGGVIAQASLEASPYGPGIFMSGAGLVSAVAILVGLRLQRCGWLQMAHIRTAPYWGREPCLSANPRSEKCRRAKSSRSLEGGSSRRSDDTEAKSAWSSVMPSFSMKSWGNPFGGEASESPVYEVEPAAFAEVFALAMRQRKAEWNISASSADSGGSSEVESGTEGVSAISASDSAPNIHDVGEFQAVQ